jgi:hypothetical protein
VQESNFAGATVSLRPIGQPGHGCARGTHKSDCDRDISARAQLSAAANRFHRVKRKGRRPRAEGHVGERWMKRMTEPRTVQEVLNFPTRWSCRFECVANEWLYLLAQAFERFLLFDCLNQRFTSHVPSPYPCVRSSQKIFSHKEAQKAQKILLILELFVLLCG